MRCTFENLIEKMIGKRRADHFVSCAWLSFFLLSSMAAPSSSLMTMLLCMAYAKRQESWLTGCALSDREHSLIPSNWLILDSPLAVQKSFNRFGSHLIETSRKIIFSSFYSSTSVSTTISLQSPLSQVDFDSDRRVFAHLRTHKESSCVFARTRHDLPRK